MNGSALYAAVWRWHFIAGLLVLPVLVMMAITGGAYLFQPELDHLAYRTVGGRAAVRAEPMAAPSVVIPRGARRPCRAGCCCSRRRPGRTGPCAFSSAWRPAKR